MSELAGLWVPGPLPGMNELIAAAKGSGGRGAAYSRLKQQWTDAVVGLAQSQKVPAFPGRVVIEWTWHERDRRRDLRQLRRRWRAQARARWPVVKAGVLKGDGWRYIQSWTDRFHVEELRPGVELSIHRYDGAVLF